MTVYLNKNSFFRMHMLSPFASKPTFARIDFLRPSGRLITRKGTQNVKFLTKIKTKTSVAHTRTSAMTRKTHTPTAANASCCWAYIKGQDHFIVLHQSLYFLLKMLEQNKNNHYICICNINRLTQTIYQHQMFFCMTKLIQKCRVAQQGGH